MARGGYNGEYKTKQELISEFGKENVVKVAIGGAMDYLILKKGRVIKVIEVKETTKKKYYPSPRDKKQFKRIIEFSKDHRTKAELWIYENSGKGKKINRIITELK